MVVATGVVDLRSNGRKRMLEKRTSPNAAKKVSHGLGAAQPNCSGLSIALSLTIHPEMDSQFEWRC